MLPNQDGARLDIFLAEATSLSRRAARRLISDGPVCRNGVPLRVQSRIVETGDVIDVLLPPSELGVAAQPTFQPLQILHQDRWLLAAGKPSGVLTAPAEKMGERRARLRPTGVAVPRPRRGPSAVSPPPPPTRPGDQRCGALRTQFRCFAGAHPRLERGNGGARLPCGGRGRSF